jgi:hypothetical protein
LAPGPDTILGPAQALNEDNARLAQASPARRSVHFMVVLPERFVFRP